jgi:thymidylate synthase
VSARSIDARNVAEGWIRACRALLGCRGAVANHLVVRMTEPLPEDPAIREAANEFARASDVQDIAEVRNTIFPAELAADFSDPKELETEYLEEYELLRTWSKQGTYFGRILQYPHPKGPPTPQLQNLIAKLRASRTGTRWRATYQLNIYAEHKDADKKRGNFPCMAHVGFQLGGDPSNPERLDCVSLYRNQDMLLKGYGNYLGLAQLQNYVAQTTGFEPGELTVIAGHATLELSGARRAKLKRLVERFDS